MVFKGSRYAVTPVDAPDNDGRTAPRVLGLRPVPRTPGALTYSVSRESASISSPIDFTRTRENTG